MWTELTNKIERSYDRHINEKDRHINEKDRHINGKDDIINKNSSVNGRPRENIVHCHVMV